MCVWMSVCIPEHKLKHKTVPIWVNLWHSIRFLNTPDDFNDTELFWMKKGEFKWFMAKNNNARVIKNNLWRRRIGFYIFFDNNLLIFLRVAKGIKNHKFMCSIGFLSFSPGRRDCLMSEDLSLFPYSCVCLWASDILTNTLKENHKSRECFAWINDESQALLVITIS